MSNLKRIVLFILSIPKIIYFNFKYLRFRDAIKFPILISKRVWIKNARGKVQIQSPISFGMIKIGFGDVAIFDSVKSRSIWDVTGTVIFRGRANIGHGVKISVSGTLILGDSFSISAESSIICKEKVSFGAHCLISWENLIMDTDFHDILDSEGNVINPSKEIVIGDNVWIGCRCTILKGTQIGNNTVIAANSCLHSIIDGSNKIIGGNLARILKEEITWRA